MAIKRKKSAWEEARDFVTQSASNIQKGASQAFNNAAKTAGSFYDSFSKDYNNYQRQQQAQAQRNRQAVSDFTSNLVKGVNQTANNVQRVSRKVPQYFDPTQDVSNKAGVQNFWTDNPLRIPSTMERIQTKVLRPSGAEDLMRTLPYGVEKLRSAGQGGLGHVLREGSNLIENMSLTPSIGGGPLNNLLPKQLRNPLGLPELTLRDTVFGGKDVDLTMGLSQKLLDDAVAYDQNIDERMKKELADLPVPKEWSPQWIARGLALNGPQLAATVAVGTGVSLLTGGAAIPGMIAMVGTGYLQSAGSTYVEARRMGADEETANQAAKIVGIINAPLDAFGAGKILNMFGKGLRGRVVAEVLKDAFSEGSTEALQQIVSNKVAQAMYDTNRGLFDQVVESGFFGVLLGGGGSVVVQTVQGPQEIPVVPTDPGEVGRRLDQITELQAPQGQESPVEEVLGEQAKNPQQMTEEINRENTILENARMRKAQLEDKAQVEFLTNPETAELQFLKENINQNGVVLSANISRLVKAYEHTIAPQEPMVDQPEFDSQLDEISQQLQEAEGDENVQTLKNDMDQALTDTGTEMVAQDAAVTGPVADDPFDADTKVVEAQLRSMLSDDDLEVLGVKDGSLVTEDGQPAWGKTANSLIQLIEENGKVQSKTAYHEALHHYVEKFANKELYQAALKEYQESESLPSDAAVEKMADDFADFVAGRQDFPGQIKAFFGDLLLKLREFVGRVSSAEMLFHNAIRGKHEGGVGEQVNYRTVDTNLFGQVQSNLTTQVLQQLPADGVIPANDVRAALNKPGVTGMEKWIIEDALKRATIDGKVNMELFNIEVKRNLFALQSKAVTPVYGPGSTRDEVILPEGVRNPEAQYGEVIYDGAIESFAGQQHFGGGPDDVSKYFAHVRFEDWPDGRRAILELQSDLMQSWLSSVLGRGTAEIDGSSDNTIELVGDELTSGKKTPTDDEIKSAIEQYNLTSADRYTLADQIKILQLEIDEGSGIDGYNKERIDLYKRMRDLLPKEPASDEQVALEGYRDTRSQFKRLIREEIVRAARDGKNSILLPTGDTIVRIEDSGLEDTGAVDMYGRLLTDKPLKGFTSDDKYKTVYDKYDKDLPAALKQIGREFNIITDERGVTWYEIAVTPEDATAQVPAFRKKKSSEQVQQPTDDSQPAQEAGSIPTEPASGKKRRGRPNVPNPEDFPRKPGELNVNRLDVNKKGKKSIYNAQENEDNTPITEDEVREWSNRVGLTEKKFTDETRKKMYAEHLNTRRRVVELEKQIQNVRAQGGSRDTIVKLLRERDRIAQLAGSQGRTAGQMLRMRAILADEINTPMNSVFQALNQLGIDSEKYLDLAADVDFNNPDQVIKFWRDVVPAKFSDWFDKVRYNAMLSSPSTHLVNLASNLQGTSLLTPIDLELQAMVDAAAHYLSFGHHKRTRAMGEGIAYTRAFWTGQKQAIKNAFNILLTGDLKFQLQQDDGPIDMKNFNPMMVPLARKGGRIPFRVQKAAEALLDVPSKLLSAEDQMSATAAERGMRAALEHRQRKGIKVKNLDETARLKAQRTIFRGDLVDPNEGVFLRAIGWVGEKLKSGANSDIALVRWPAKMSIPFINIGTNLAKQGFEANPVTGAINLLGNKDKVSSVSKMIMGAGFTYTAMLLAQNGNLIGAEDEDKTKRDQGRAAGKIPWSVKIGDVYLQFNKMHPVMAFQFGMVAAVTDALEQNKLSEDKAQTIFDSIAKTLAYFNDQTYWRNIGDFTNVMNGDPYAVSSLVYNYPAQTIPFRALMSYATRIVDEYQRAPDPDANLIPQVMQRIMGGIPGLSDNVPTRKGPYGEDMKWNMRMENLVSPYRLSREDPDNARIYEKMKVRADVNKQVKMLGDDTKEALGSAELTTPQEKMAQKEKDLDKDINRGRIKLEKGSGDKLGGKSVEEVTAGVYQWANDNGEITTLDLNKYKKGAQGISKYKLEEQKYKDARTIWDSPMSQDSKNKAFKELGVEPDDVRYDVLANHTNEVSTKYLVEKLTDQPHETVLERLITGRMESISGEIFVTDGVLDNLVDEGLITKNEAKYLKSISFDRKTGALKTKGGGSGKKVSFKLDVDIPEPKLVKLNLPSAGGEGLGSGANSKLLTGRVKRIPVKLPKLDQGESFNVQKPGRIKITPYGGSGMAKTLSGLGRS